MSGIDLKLVDELDGELQFEPPSAAELAALDVALALDAIARTVAVGGEVVYRTIQEGQARAWVNAAWHYPKSAWVALDGQRLPDGQLVEIVIDEQSRLIPGQFTVWLYAHEDPNYMATVLEDA